MTINDFLKTYQDSMLNRKMINPLSASSTKPPPLNPPVGNRATFGSSVPDWLKTRTDNAVSEYTSNKSEKTSELATDYAKKAAGQIPVDRYGIVQDKTTDFTPQFNSQIQSISNRGKLSLATEEAKATWQQLQNSQDMAAGFTTNLAPGASSGNMGARAVSAAMDAMKRGIPYVWGGTSLSSGVDCSGLVQAIYSKLGVKVPRTTYEQAKSGKRVPLSNLLPGDLVFYHTGGRDPNGIGSLSHVAIYLGNGKVISALNRRAGITVQPLNNNNGAVMAVRPW